MATSGWNDLRLVSVWQAFGGARIALQVRMLSELGAVELELDPRVEIQPENLAQRITRKMHERRGHSHYPSC